MKEAGRWGSQEGFFNPVIPTQISGNPVISRVIFGISPTSGSYFSILNLDPILHQNSESRASIREIPDPEKPIGDPWG